MKLSLRNSKVPVIANFTLTVSSWRSVSSHVLTSTVQQLEKEELLLGNDILNRVWILRQLLHPLNVIDSMEFLASKMKGTKTNQEFLDSMFCMSSVASVHDKGPHLRAFFCLHAFRGFLDPTDQSRYNIQSNCGVRYVPRVRFTMKRLGELLVQKKCHLDAAAPFCRAT